MAVSKIAVMALVGILAIPILLGYAFNLSEVPVTEYKPDISDPVNVSQLLQNSTAYNYVHADINQLNTNFDTDFGKMYPHYNSISSTKTTMPLNQQIESLASGAYNTLALDQFADGNDTVSIQNPANENLTLIVWDPNWNEQLRVGFIKDFTFDFSTLTMKYSYYYNWVLYSGTYTALANNYQIAFQNQSSNTINLLKTTVGPNTNTYADLSAGFYFDEDSTFMFSLPVDTRSITMTFNLDSITSSSYEIRITGAGSVVHLQKSTTAGVVSWIVPNGNEDNTDLQLYYDPSRNDNTYQVTIESKLSSEYDDNGNTRYKYDSSTTYRYVGSWPAKIGQANYYREYKVTFETDTGNPATLDALYFTTFPYDTPTMRFDDALYRGMEYPAINSNTYDPGTFKTNPATTIKDIQLYGSALIFGGNTYKVDKDGNITLGNHKIPVNNMVLDSVPVPVGYENRINGTVVSVSQDPSTITFDGQWVANISTSNLAASTYTKTEWTAGSFGWDGMDSNFLIVGLITCLGVFIGLGIYARKTGKGVIPLLIVCGGAAALFICMI